jgi:hypothetical protein
VVHAALSLAMKKRSVIGALHMRASLQFEKFAHHLQMAMELARVGGSSHMREELLAAIAERSARNFANAAEAFSAVTDPAAQEDLVNLYKIAADLQETDELSVERSGKQLDKISSPEALAVADTAGQRYAAAARARAQGNIPLRNAWVAASDATARLVRDQAPRRAKHRRTRVLTEDYSPEALARADQLAAAAEGLERACFTYTDLTQEGSVEDDAHGADVAVGGEGGAAEESKDKEQVAGAAGRATQVSPEDR